MIPFIFEDLSLIIKKGSVKYVITIYTPATIFARLNSATHWLSVDILKAPIPSLYRILPTSSVVPDKL